jgi:sugar (pentulose or hexulose) kinase
LEKLLADRPAPRHGLTVLPFWTAERAPSWNEDAEGTIAGLRQSTTAVDILQAVTEGFYHRLALIAEMIAGDDQPKWIVAGGILKSRSALRRLANVMGRGLYANPEPEASLRGAAVFAIEKLGHPVADLRYGSPVVPNPTLHRLYRADRQRQATLEAALSRRQQPSDPG